MKEGGAEMLTEERFAEILRMLGEEKSVTVQELTERLATSESTIRRDLTALAEKGITGESSWWGDGFGDGLYNQRCRNHIADDTECR